ncbi:MAG: hypothetical protein F2677_03325 [Actinobacteria bacterium]|uniref:Unannotated protein n=1 Tax=freshwater metagenome TaxID=449393 RepID=A0A6J6Q5D4_9ZZZZ|nr:hypothetical protein [Actinomycetota bacterium]
MTSEKEIAAKIGWNIDANDQRIARRYIGGWGEPQNVESLKLDYLHKIETHLDRIRFRLGFIALFFLIGLLVLVFGFIGSFGGLVQP